MGDLVPNLWDQLDFSSPKSNYDMMQKFNSQLKRQVTSRKVQFLFFCCSIFRSGIRRTGHPGTQTARTSCGGLFQISALD